MRILLTGAAGQLGRELKRSLACLGDVIARDRQQLDLARADTLRAAVRTAAPAVIVNAAAYTAVDKAETEPTVADAINELVAAMLAEEAKRIGEQLGVDWSKYDVEQFRLGLDVELEHGAVDLNINVTNDDPLMTGKIALAHLNEFADYYTRLERLEEEAKEFWSK